MLNQVILVGRIKSIIDGFLNVEIIGTTPQQKKVVEIKVSDNIFKNAKEYCKVGDLVGIKGKLSLEQDVFIEGEKLTFLSSGKNNEGGE